MMAHQDPSELSCRFCLTRSIFSDQSQGDLICTSCGVVHAEKLLSAAPEWRDYSSANVNDDAKMNVARAGSAVDESRWNGGLEPTTLGKVFGGYDRDAEKNRKSLNKVKKAVDYWMDRDFERRVEESRLAIHLKSKDAGRSADGVQDDHRDWTDMGTNEHEQIARRRMEEVEPSQKMLVSEKWSLDRALLLHGSDDEIPDRYRQNHSNHGKYGETRDVEDERNIMLKRMDASQRKASFDLYKCYSINEQALRRLNFQQKDGIMAEVMDVITKYANLKGGFTVKGVSTRIATSSSSSSSKRMLEEHRNHNKARQMAALGAAFVYLICKKNGLGRTLAEICSSYRCEDAHGNTSTGKKQTLSSQQSSETFIKAKHCSKAMNEIRTLMPEYMKSVTIATGNMDSGIAADNGASTNTKLVAVKSESTNSSTSPELPTTRAGATSSGKASSATNHHAMTTTTNLVEHSLKRLKLSPVSLAAITNLVLYTRQTMHDQQLSRRPAVLIAAIAYLVCDSGAIMQRLAAQATAVKKEVTTNVGTAKSTTTLQPTAAAQAEKRKHIRPSGKRSPVLKRQRLNESNDNKMIPLTTTSAGTSPLDNEKKPTSVTPDPEPFDVLSHSIEEMPSSSPLPSWSEWKRQQKWQRSIREIERCCNVTSSAVRECYSKRIFPIRKDLLSVLQASFSANTTIDECHVDIMMRNVVVAAPLMAAIPK